MGQVLYKDKIGALSHSGGTITLQPSILTIGGRQYVTEEINYNLRPFGFADDDTRFYVYAVVSGGSVTLIESKDDNDTGPSGYTAWKLVGIFRTDESINFYQFGTVDQNGEIQSEFGRNANGNWERRADGTQICSILGITLTYDSSTALFVAWTFPIAFINSSFMTTWSAASLPPGSKREFHHRVGGRTTTTVDVLAVGNGVFASGDTVNADVISVGRWK